MISALRNLCLISVDVFYGYHVETKHETGDALGIAIGLYF